MKNLIINTYANYLLLTLKLHRLQTVKGFIYDIMAFTYNKMGLQSMVDDGTLRHIIENQPIDELENCINKLKITKNFERFQEEMLDLTATYLSNAYQMGAEHHQKTAPLS